MLRQPRLASFGQLPRTLFDISYPTRRRPLERGVLQSCAWKQFTTSSRGDANTASGAIPWVVQSSLWTSLVPKFLRHSNTISPGPKKPESKEWNPATFFIVIFMLIGSNAIQLIALKNDFVAFSRKADAKIGLLREVIERVQKGEDVDVAGLLGTGDKEQEKEWEEVLKELEEEDENWLSKSQRWREKAEKALHGSDENKESVNNFTTQDTMDDVGDVSKSSNTKSRSPKAVSGFY